MVDEGAPVGREPRPQALARNQTLLDSASRHDVKTASVALGTKHDARAVRGKIGIVVVGLARRDPQRLAAPRLLDPYVQIAASGAVRGESQQATVARETRAAGQ